VATIRRVGRVDAIRFEADGIRVEARIPPDWRSAWADYETEDSRRGPCPPTPPT